MAGRGREPYEDKCAAGKPLKRGTGIACAHCGAGPLHPPYPFPGRCLCSFAREGMQLCRDCAIGFDLAMRGGTKIVTSCRVDRETVSLVRRGFGVVGKVT